MCTEHLTCNDEDKTVGKDIIIKRHLIWQIKRIVSMYIREVNYNTEDYLYNLEKTKGMINLLNDIVDLINNLNIDVTKGENK